jgi:hypothetical protein
MNKQVKHKTEMFGRAIEFSKTSGMVFSDHAQDLFAELETVLGTIHKSDGNQVLGFGGFRAGAFDRTAIIREMRKRVRAIAKTARSLDAAQYPTVAQQFQRARSRTYAGVRATAEAFANAAEPIKQAFIDREMPADFVVSLRALITAFDTASQRKANGLQGQVGGTVDMDLKGRDGRTIVDELDAIISNQLEKQDNRGLLAVWKGAIRLERVNKRNADKSQAAPTAPAAAPAA